MADKTPAAKTESKPDKTPYRLEVDTLGYLNDDGVREEVEGKGTVHTDLHPNAVARGLELKALVKLTGKDAKAATEASSLPDFDAMDDDELVTAYVAISPQTDQAEVEATLKTNRGYVVEFVRDNYAAHP